MLHLSVQQEAQIVATFRSLHKIYKQAEEAYRSNPSEALRRAVNIAVYKLVHHVENAQVRYQIELDLDTSVGWYAPHRPPFDPGKMDRVPLDAETAIRLKAEYRRLSGELEGCIKVTDDTEEAELWVIAYGAQDEIAHQLARFKVEAEYKHNLPLGWWDSATTTL